MRDDKRLVQYAEAARSVLQIGRELGVEMLMEGTVSCAHGAVVVRVQLIDARTGVCLWSDSYSRKLAGVLVIEADVAAKVTNALSAEISGEERPAVAGRVTSDQKESRKNHDLPKFREPSVSNISLMNVARGRRKTH